MCKLKTDIYTSEHLSLFEKELKEAGAFNELMFRKSAFVQKNDKIFIVIYENTREYKEKYLLGKYESLRSFYKTKIPYTFWRNLYIELRIRKTTEQSI